MADTHSAALAAAGCIGCVLCAAADSAAVFVPILAYLQRRIRKAAQVGQGTQQHQLTDQQQQQWGCTRCACEHTHQLCAGHIQTTPNYMCPPPAASVFCTPASDKSVMYACTAHCTTHHLHAGQSGSECIFTPLPFSPPSPTLQDERGSSRGPPTKASRVSLLSGPHLQYCRATLPPLPASCCGHSGGGDGSSAVCCCQAGVLVLLDWMLAWPLDSGVAGRRAPQTGLTYGGPVGLLDEPANHTGDTGCVSGGGGVLRGACTLTGGRGRREGGRLSWESGTKQRHHHQL